jgi:hypothetical protein
MVGGALLGAATGGGVPAIIAGGLGGRQVGRGIAALVRMFHNERDPEKKAALLAQLQQVSGGVRTMFGQSSGGMGMPGGSWGSNSGWGGSGGWGGGSSYTGGQYGGNAGGNIGSGVGQKFGQR